MIIGNLAPTPRTLPTRAVAGARPETSVGPADCVQLGQAAPAAGVPSARLSATAEATAFSTAVRVAPGTLAAGWAQANSGRVRAIEREVLFTPFAYEGLHALPPEQQQSFLGLAASLPGSRADLLALLASGKLAEKDSRGGLLVDNLVTLRGQEPDRGFGGEDGRRLLVEQTLAALVDPDTIVQGRHGTCPAASLEFTTAQARPSEYVRLLAGLLGPAGGAPLPNGDWLARDHGLEKRDQSGRRDISRVFQGSLMQYAVGPLVDYDNQADWNKPLQATAQQTLGINKGLYTQEIKLALEGLTGQAYDAPSYRDVPAERAEFLRRTGAAEEGAPLPVVLRWVKPQGLDQGFHVVLFEGLQGDQVLVRNPQGAVDDGSPGAPELDFPTRTSLGGGHLSIPADVFFDRLQAWFAPSATR